LGILVYQKYKIIRQRRGKRRGKIEKSQKKKQISGKEQGTVAITEETKVVIQRVTVDLFPVLSYYRAYKQQ
jgi:hypothetical protein